MFGIRDWPADNGSDGQVSGGPSVRDGGVLVILPAVFLVITTRYWGSGFFDDSFIFLRYAQNLSLGHGVVWNVGEPGVDGNTSLVWLLLVGFVLKFSALSAANAVRLLGISFGIFSLGAAWRIARLLLPEQNRKAALAVPTAMVFSPYFSRQATNGLETLLTTSCFLALTLFWFACVRRKKTSSFELVSLAVASSSMFFVRPDAVLFALVGSLLTLRLAAETFEARLIAKFSVLFGTILAASLTAKFLLIGSIVPLPFFMKSPFRLFFFEKIPFNYMLGHWLELFSILAAPILILAASFIARPWRAGRLFLILTIPSALYVSSLMLAIPVMDVHWRFFFPCYPFLIAAAVYGALKLGAAYEGGSPRVIALLLIILTFCQAGYFPRVKLEMKTFFEDHAQYARLGAALNSIHGATLATTEAGQLPYFSDWQSIDLAGLNDEFIAKNRFRPDIKNLFANYLSKKMPDLYVQPPPECWYADMESHPTIRAQYERKAAFGLVLYLRRNSPAFDEMSRICAAQTPAYQKSQEEF